MNRKQYVLIVALSVVAGLVGGVVSSWFFVGTPVFAQKTPQVAEVIRAKRFEVVDKKGQPRAALSVTEAGEPSLRLRDKKGQIRATLYLPDTGGPSFSLGDKNGQLRAGLFLTDNGEPFLRLGDKNGQPRAALFSDTEGPSLQLQDKNGRIRAVLGHIELEKLRTGTIIKKPASSLILFRENGKIIWETP